MSHNSSQISENSRRIARNTVLLYFRMFLLLIVGLFSSRVVINSLGVSNYGIYTAVAGLVTLFTIVTSAIGNAISRFITCEIEKGDPEKLHRLFATSLIIQLFFCLVVILIAETLGLWFLNTRMDIPAGRLGAANWVLQCSTLVLVFNLLNLPFYATIIAHEDMKIYAYISILEAVLKLAVALMLYISGFDKLKVYAVLMLIVAIIVRLCYGAYCHRHFSETRGKLVFDKNLTGQIMGFAGWNALNSCVFMVNTQGINVLMNLVFGVVANAARGVATQVEGIVKQFVNNVIIALNPQITKSYVADDKEYSYDLFSKSAKYAYLIVLFFAVPTFFEAQTILTLWLRTVPEGAALFTKLTIVCVLMDLLMTSASTMILADGRIKGFYIWICSITVMITPLAWLAFKLGAPAYSAYVVFIADYAVLDCVKLIQLHKITGYPYMKFIKDVLMKIIMPTVISIPCCLLVTALLPEATWWRALITTGISSVTIVASAFFFSLSKGEKQIILEKIHLHK